VASFHHPLTVHGSLPNTSSRPRRAIALNFCRDGTKSATAEPLLAGVPVIGKGEPLGGQFFPLVYASPIIFTK
jgi:ectoine hydroxylase-related dioxygenase (phytanoyl-CoA dioxygenase family)